MALPHDGALRRRTLAGNGLHSLTEGSRLHQRPHWRSSELRWKGAGKVVCERLGVSADAMRWICEVIEAALAGFFFAVRWPPAHWCAGSMGISAKHGVVRRRPAAIGTTVGHRRCLPAGRDLSGWALSTLGASFPSASEAPTIPLPSFGHDDVLHRQRLRRPPAQPGTPQAGEGRRELSLSVGLLPTVPSTKHQSWRP